MIVAKSPLVLRLTSTPDFEVSPHDAMMEVVDMTML
jgi:hypothetical protein